MKHLIVIILGISFLGCASKGVVVKERCNPIMFRQDQFVCGKDRVMKGCRDLNGRPEVVCDEL